MAQTEGYYGEPRRTYQPPIPPAWDTWLPYPPPQPRPGRPPIALDEVKPSVTWPGPEIPWQYSWVTAANAAQANAQALLAREQKNLDERARWKAAQNAYAARAGQAAGPTWPGVPQRAVTADEGGGGITWPASDRLPGTGLPGTGLPGTPGTPLGGTGAGVTGPYGGAGEKLPGGWTQPQTQAAAGGGPGDWYSTEPLPGEEEWWAAFAKEHDNQTPYQFYHGNVAQARADRDWGGDYAAAHPMFAGLPSWQAEELMRQAYKNRAFWTRYVTGKREVEWDIDPLTGRYIVKYGPAPTGRGSLDEWQEARQAPWWWSVPGAAAATGTETQNPPLVTW